MSDAYNSVKDGVESVHKGVNDQVWQTKHPAARPLKKMKTKQKTAFAAVLKWSLAVCR